MTPTAQDAMPVAPRRPLSDRVAIRRGGISSTDLMQNYRRLVVSADLLAGSLAAAIAAVSRFGWTPIWYYALATAAFPVLWVLAVLSQRGYEERFLGAGADEYRRIGDAALWLFAITAAVTFAAKVEPSRAYVLIVLPLALLFTVIGRRVTRGWLFARRLSGDGLHRVLVVGRADAVAHLIEQFDREPWHGLAAVGACVPAAESDHGLGEMVPVLGDPDEILAAVDALEADVVAVVSHPDLSNHTLRRLGWALDERGVDLMVSPGIVEVAGPRLSIRPVAGLSLLHLEHPSITGGLMLVKAAADRVLAATLLLLAAPLMAVVAAAVRFSSPGPVIFRQKRIGVDGRVFSMLKFRSMVADAEDRRDVLLAANERDGHMFKIRDDPRVTRVGAVLRRFSLDELPQLWNVLRGEMSLVGPRPPLPDEVARYDYDAVRRLRVKPGLTGLWQVSGRSDLSWEETLRLDLRYVDNWTPWLDASILWRTGRAVLTRHGAY